MEQAYLFNRGEDYMSYNLLGSRPYVNENGEAIDYSLAETFVPYGYNFSYTFNYHRLRCIKQSVPHLHYGDFHENLPSIHRLWSEPAWQR